MLYLLLEDVITDHLSFICCHRASRYNRVKKNQLFFISFYCTTSLITDYKYTLVTIN